MKIYKRLAKYMAGAKSYGVLSVVLSLSSAGLTGLGYYFVYMILIKLLVKGDAMAARNLAIQTMVLLTAGGGLYFVSAIFSHKLGFRLETNMRKKGIEGISNASFRFFDINASGVIRKTIDDNAEMTHAAVAHMLPDMGQAIVVPISAFVIAFFVSLRLGIAIIVTVVTSSYFMGKMMGGENSFMKEYQDALKRLGGETVEYIRGIQVIKIFQADVKSFKTLYESIGDYAKNVYAYSRSCKFPYVTYQWIFYVALPFIIILISFRLDKIVNANFLMVEMVMFFFLTGIILVSLMRMMYGSMHIFNASYALNNLEKMYDETHKNRLQFGKETEFKNYNISFENACFSYGEVPVFENLSFQLEENKTYALVGASGSGKSTIAKLLSGFYKLDYGSIKIGGKAIEEYTEKAIIKAISFIFQNPKLFKKTIYENVELAKEGATTKEVFDALKLAGCDDILDKFPQREKTVIGSNGVYLSGGEKQRIAIARAILKASPIVIMDEASAAIDADNEYKLQKSFKNLMKNKTVIMIAHRLSSIKNVDEIIVLDKGKIVERGSHNELLKQNGKYKEQVDLYNTANNWRLSYE